MQVLEDQVQQLLDQKAALAPAPILKGKGKGKVNDNPALAKAGLGANGKFIQGLDIQPITRPGY